MKKRRVYGCQKCETIFETIESYSKHRLECYKNKDHAFRSLVQLGLTEPIEEVQRREAVLKFEETLEKNFKAGKF